MRRGPATGAMGKAPSSSHRARELAACCGVPRRWTGGRRGARQVQGEPIREHRGGADAPRRDGDLRASRRGGERTAGSGGVLGGRRRDGSALASRDGQAPQGTDLAAWASETTLGDRSVGWLWVLDRLGRLGSWHPEQRVRRGEPSPDVGRGVDPEVADLVEARREGRDRLRHRRWSLWSRLSGSRCPSILSWVNR